MIFGTRPVGSYTCRVIQADGYDVYPIIEDFTGNLLCGDLFLVSFP
jgi:hypothetical protein